MQLNDEQLAKCIICHHSYWDGPLTAYVMIDGKIFYAECIIESEDDDRNRLYSVKDVEWNDKCDEWLKDYKICYPHVFDRSVKYKNMPFDFGEKWKHWHPAKQ